MPTEAHPWLAHWCLRAQWQPCRQETRGVRDWEREMREKLGEGEDNVEGHVVHFNPN
jgi:hypothetical protein